MSSNVESRDALEHGFGQKSNHCLVPTKALVHLRPKFNWVKHGVDIVSWKVNMSPVRRPLHTHVNETHGSASCVCWCHFWRRCHLSSGGSEASMGWIAGLHCVLAGSQRGMRECPHMNYPLWLPFKGMPRFIPKMHGNAMRGTPRRTSSHCSLQEMST